MIKVLEKAGYEVMLAKNGKQAIDMIKIHDFDCILRDVQMPLMDTQVGATKKECRRHIVKYGEPNVRSS